MKKLVGIFSFSYLSNFSFVNQCFYIVWQGMSSVRCRLESFFHILTRDMYGKPD